VAGRDACLLPPGAFPAVSSPLMPRILITGLPTVSRAPDALRLLLTESLPTAVQGIHGFGIAQEHVYAYAVADSVTRPSIVVTFSIDGLIAKPERTATMRQTLCAIVADSIVRYLEESGTTYEAVIGWCEQIDRADDGFVRRVPPRLA